MLISLCLSPVYVSPSSHLAPSIYLLNILISFSYAKVHIVPHRALSLSLSLTRIHICSPFQLFFFPLYFFFFFCVHLMSKKSCSKSFFSRLWQSMLLDADEGQIVLPFWIRLLILIQILIQISLCAYPGLSSFICHANSLDLSTCQIKIKFQMNK